MQLLSLDWKASPIREFTAHPPTVHIGPCRSAYATDLPPLGRGCDRVKRVKRDISQLDARVDRKIALHFQVWFKMCCALLSAGLKYFKFVACFCLDIVSRRVGGMYRKRTASLPVGTCPQYQ